MKVLFICHSYLKGNNGGIYASKAYINAFAELSDEMTLLYPYKKGMEPEDIMDEKITMIPVEDTRSKIKKYLDLIRGHVHRYQGYAINFIARSNLKYEDIKEILSKYDTKFLFGYTYSDNYSKEILKKYLNEKYSADEVEKIYNKFSGDEKELFEYLKHLVVYGSDYRGYYSIQRNMYSVKKDYLWDNESEYYVRFASEEDYLKAREELENHEYIDIEHYYSSEIEQIKDNSIILRTPEGTSFAQAEGVLEAYEAAVTKEVKNALEGYDINYTAYSMTRDAEKKVSYFTLVLSDIKSDEFDKVLTILEDLTKQNEEILDLDLYITKDRCLVTFNRKYYDVKPEYRQKIKSYTKYLKVGYKNSDKYVVTRNADTFLSSINEDSIIYPLEEIELKTIYRLYNKHTGEHLFTSKKSEYDKLEKKGWTKEGETFNGCNDKDAKGVYRVYNPNAKGGDHHYTKSYSEAEKLVGKGWKWDNNGGPLFYAAGDKKVYRLYNKVDGRHHYTPKVKEKEKLVGLGWVDEGVAWETLE